MVDHIQSSTFPKPSVKDLGNLSSAILLHNACRLAFRNGAGPFRSFSKLSFRPRPYQLEVGGQQMIFVQRISEYLRYLKHLKFLAAVSCIIISNFDKIQR